VSVMRIKKLLILAAMCLAYNVSVFATSGPTEDFDTEDFDFEWLRQELNAMRRSQMLEGDLEALQKGFEVFVYSLSNYSAPDRVSTFPARTITAVDGFRPILLSLPPELIVNEHVQRALNIIALHIFNLYIGLNQFGTKASNDALVLLHYTVVYHLELNDVFNKNDAFKPFCNQAGVILTPQEFAHTVGQRSGKAYFRHWSKFLPDHRMPKPCCSIS
jgi:hypothetical protein